MAVDLQLRDIENAIGYAGRLRDHARSISHQGEYVMGTVGQQATSGLAAFGYGVVLGRYGEVRIGPLPADVLGAACLHGAGFLGVFGEQAGHAHNAAQGLVDGYLQRVGIGLGARMMQQAKAPPPAARVSGRPLPQPLTVADVVAIADASR